MRASAIEGRLTATWPTDVNHWLKAANLKTAMERQQVFVFTDMQSVSGQRFADGALIRRFWIAQNRSGLVATPHRTYFQGSQPDRRLERLILGTNERPKSNRTGALALLTRAIDVLMQARPDFMDIPLRDLSAIHAYPIKVRERDVTADGSVNSIYRRHGFDHVPAGWRISVIPLDGVTHTQALEFQKRISDAASSRRAMPQVMLSSMATVRSRLSQLDSSETGPLPGSILLLLLPRRSAPPTDEVLDVLSSLERCRVPFRRAYADDPLEFSIPDQLPSLLIAAGGRPHAIHVTHRFRDALTVGIDLSHPTNSSVSRLAVTIVDQAGMLAWVTRMEVPRDETINADIVRRLGELVRTWLHEHGRLDDPLIVLRDGRIPERELVSHWLDCFGRNLAVIEVRKRGNPILFEAEAVEMKKPYAVQIENSNTVLTAATAPIDPAAMTEPLKLTWTAEANPIRLTPAEIANHVLSHCHAPGLGLHAHRLPSAIYWADGIAGSDNFDLRFRGIPLA